MAPGRASAEVGSAGDGEVVSAGPAVAARLAMPPPEDIVAELVAAGVRVRGFSVERESLEERFVALTGEGFDVAQ
jgi:ABC-2 type transport system ATP-binding protein